MTDNLLTRWIILVLVTAGAVWAIIGNWGPTGPLNLGIDLRGGYSITYSISPESLRTLLEEGGNLDDAMDETIQVISTRIDGLGLREMTVRREGTNRIIIQAPDLTQAEVDAIKDRMLQLGKLEFTIGLGEMQKTDKGNIDIPTRTPGQYRAYSFNQEQAEAQRQAALANKDSGYRDGMPYRLKDADGKTQLPITWLPYHPGYLKDRFGMDEEECREALRKARRGEEYDKDKIRGGWVYADPRWWGDGQPGFTGRDISEVRKGQGQMGDRVVLYNVERSRQADFEQYTNKYVDWPMVIALNDEIWSAPNINSALSDNVMIEGGSNGFSEEEQDFLVTGLKSGSLKLRPIEEGSQQISASLGTDAVNRGVNASILGLLLVVAFMVFYYRLGGIIATVALLTNLLLLLAILALFQATLTLPGIAGIILTIGMAVDANILIFARVREELEKGKTLVASMQAGYGRAFVTILDANLTTFFTAVILFQYGVGPIKGFAITLMAGIACSLFCAVFMTRLVFGWLIKSGLMTGFKMKRIVPADVNIKFLDKSRTFVTVSLLLIVASLVTFTSLDDKYGLDFTGGTIARMNFKEPMRTSEVVDRIKAIRDSSGEVKYTEISPIGLADTQEGNGFRSLDVHIQSRPDISPNVVTGAYRPHVEKVFGDRLAQIREPTQDKATDDWILTVVLKEDAYKVDIDKELEEFKDSDGNKVFQSVSRTALDEHEDEDTGEKMGKEWALRIPEALLGTHDVINDLRKTFKNDITATNPFPRTNFVGPNVVANLKEKAVVAIILSLIVTILYIWFRFKELKYGMAAALAVFHDVIIALGIVVTVNAIGAIHVPLNLAIIAGFLTIVGYSLNDTIVLFDRVRENLGNIEGSYRHIVNTSINQTLARTVLTSLTTFFVVAVLCVMNYGQESPIEGIAFTLMVGVVVGTYSSIFIASPIVVWLHSREQAKQALKK